MRLSRRCIAVHSGRVAADEAKNVAPARADNARRWRFGWRAGGALAAADEARRRRADRRLPDDPRAPTSSPTPTTGRGHRGFRRAAALVSGLHHQADDALRRVPRRAGRRDHARIRRSSTARERRRRSRRARWAFKPGTTLTLDDALKIMMVKSANDIAVAVAEAVGGSVAGFAERMNAESQRARHDALALRQPARPARRAPGAPRARDMALLARALLDGFPAAPRLSTSCRRSRSADKVLKNYNPLLERYPGATGMKTGFICASGYNLVASAKRGERELIAVVFGEYGGKARTRARGRAARRGLCVRRYRDRRRRRCSPSVAIRRSLSPTPLDMRPYVCGPRRPPSPRRRTRTAREARRLRQSSRT